jgi:phosphomannomutase
MNADHDPDTAAILRDLLDRDDLATLAQYWAHPLRFGTAGLRGPLQAGPSGINRRTVRRATQGVAAWLSEQGPDHIARGVVVGCDARHGSRDFYGEVLDVFATLGVPTHALPPHLPTPLVPFAVQHLGAAAGVMITASHNPPGDNGYKLYVADGAQVNTPDDAAIEWAMGRAPEFGTLPHVTPDAKGPDLVAAYEARVRAQFAGAPSSLRVVYTPLHGVGGDLFLRLARDCGFVDLHVVESQRTPDGAFPTVAFPNPEEPGALDAAYRVGDDVDADLIVANDPDADRVALAVRDGAGWRPLTGDEIGWLLGARALRRGVPPGHVVACSVVSSPLLGRMAAAAGVPFVTTLTGFKWIARAGDASGARLAFGYEEALGYAVDPTVRDKDGLTAALALLREADDAAQRGHTLLDRLADIRTQWGDVRTGQVAVRASGPDGLAALTARVATIAATPPRTLGGLAVTATDDLAEGYQGLPPTTGLVLTLAHHGRVVIRPSGTEPKVKAYVEALGADTLAAVLADVGQLLS